MPKTRSTAHRRVSSCCFLYRFWLHGKGWYAGSLCSRPFVRRLCRVRSRSNGMRILTTQDRINRDGYDTVNNDVFRVAATHGARLHHVIFCGEIFCCVHVRGT
ncbi:unnamed protein product [Ectocarpus sp. 12 AP-2014]